MRHLLDKLLDWEARHDRLLSIVFGAFFVVSMANYARFIALPQLPFVTEEQLFWISAGWNALWYGFARPAVLRRKRARVTAEPTAIEK